MFTVKYRLYRKKLLIHFFSNVLFPGKVYYLIGSNKRNCLWEVRHVYLEKNVTSTLTPNCLTYFRCTLRHPRRRLPSPPNGGD